MASHYGQDFHDLSDLIGMEYAIKFCIEFSKRGGVHIPKKPSEQSKRFEAVIGQYMTDKLIEIMGGCTLHLPAFKDIEKQIKGKLARDDFYSDSWSEIPTTERLEQLANKYSVSATTVRRWVV